MKTVLTVVITAAVVLLLVSPMLVTNWKQASASVPAPTPAPVPAPAPAASEPAPLFPDVTIPPPGTVPTGAPRVLTQIPGNGATGVPTSTQALIVTFDQPMADSFSWTGGGDAFPETAGKPSWSPDHRTCMLPVRLRPNHSYQLGLNSQSFRNFRSAQGVELTPMVWTFTTGQ